MSADNTIVIIKTKRTALETSKGHWKNRHPNEVFRVAEVQAFDNFDYYKESQLYNLGAYLYSVFKNSSVFKNKEDAMEYARKIEENAGYVEYGIREYDLSEFIFWSDI